MRILVRVDSEVKHRSNSKKEGLKDLKTLFTQRQKGEFFEKRKNSKNHQSSKKIQSINAASLSEICSPRLRDKFEAPNSKTINPKKLKKIEELKKVCKRKKRARIVHSTSPCINIIKAESHDEVQNKSSLIKNGIEFDSSNTNWKANSCKMLYDSSFQNNNQHSFDENGTKRLKSQLDLHRSQTNPSIILTARGQNSNFLNFQSMKADRYICNYNQQQIYEEFDPKNMRIEIRKSLNVPVNYQISRSNNASMAKELSKSKLIGSHNSSIDCKILSPN